LLKDLKTSIGSETNSEDSGSFSTLNSQDITVSPSLNSLVSFNKNINSPINLKKKGLKQIIQNNFHKVSNIFNSKNQNKIEENLSNTELDKVFEDINQSCDVIIDDNNIGITAEFDDNSESLLYDDFNNEDNIPYCDNNYRDNMKTASFDEYSKSIECKIEDIVLIKSENTKLDDLNEVCIEQTIVDNTVHHDIIEPIIEEQTVVKNDKKKKRSNKKKK
jgi:hypothetical protein